VPPSAADLGTAAGGARRIGVCVSGGGFRASFYALGALRYLAEAELLQRVQVISAVSGGSIAAGMVADRWDSFIGAGGTVEAFLDEIDRPFRRAVTTRNLRNIWLLWALLYFLPSLFTRKGSRGVTLAWTLGRHLYTRKRLGELPAGPQVIFTSTELGRGRAFRMSRDFVGSFDLGYAAPPPARLDLGVAVAASAAFPLSFTVISVPTAELGLPGAPPQVLSLVDGGVYDNTGLEWFQGWESGRPASARRPEFVIAVNASGVLEKTTRRYGSLRALLRELNVQYQQTLNLRVRWMIDRLISGRDRGVYVGIGLDPRAYTDLQGRPIDPSFYGGALPSSLVAPLAHLRTDLDRFSPDEAELLSYHGYWSLHARLATLAPDLAVAAPRWNEPRYAQMSAAEEARLLALLQAGRKRKLWRR
jgi:NTE family protein